MTATPGKGPWLGGFVMLAALWGSSFLFMRLGAQEFGALPTAGLRVAIASLLLLPLLCWRGLAPELLANWKKILFIGAFNSALPFACFSYALLSISTGLSAILNATVPMFGALVAWVWLKDRPHASRITGLVLGFVGIAMLAWDKASFKPDASGLSSGWAVLACLFACLSYGTSASFTKRYLAGSSALVTAAGSQLGATICLALPTLWLWPSHSPSMTAWLALLFLGIFCTGLAYILFFGLIENIGPARALTVTFVVPVFAMVYGFVFLGETVSAWMLFCGAIIIIGTALAANLIQLSRR